VPPATKRPTPEELKLKLSKKGAATTAATTIKRKGGRGLRESALHTQMEQQNIINFQPGGNRVGRRVFNQKGR
jgi:hypothetical protein